MTTRGSGETVVLLHGLGGTHRYWQAGLEGTTARSVMVDVLGFGESPRPWRRYSLAVHLDALEDALLPHAPFALIGHSMGAVLALALAARRPDLVTRLGLLSLPCYASEAAAYDWMRRLPGGWVYTNIFAAALACMITRRVSRLVCQWSVSMATPTGPRRSPTRGGSPSDMPIGASPSCRASTITPGCGCPHEARSCLASTRQAHSSASALDAGQCRSRIRLQNQTHDRPV